MSEPNDAVQSQLSAFVDNELPQDETELLARRLSRDPELQHALSRYLMIGEALRAPSQARVSRDFSLRVAAAIENDKAVAGGRKAKSPKPMRHWLKPAMGMGLAASVAAISVLSISHLQNANVVAPTAQLATTAGNTGNSQLPANSYVVPVATTTPSVPISATRLTNYVVAHSEFTSPLGRRNMLTGLVTSDQKSEETVENVDDSGSGQ